MGVKSTKFLTEKQARAKLNDFLAERDIPNYIMEELLERLNDFVNDGEGFENYCVTGGME